MCGDSGLYHVQLAMPRGGEARAWAYFAGRAGVWFALPDGRQLHLGVEEPFRPSEKAHPAFGCAALDALARRLEEGGYTARWDAALAPRRSFYGEDPFGNRIEFIEP